MFVELSFREQNIIEKLESVDRVFKNLKVSFDIDGVEANSADGAIAKLNRILGTNYTADDLTGYWTMVDLIRKNRPEIEDPRDFAIKLWNSEDVLGAAPPVSGAWLLSNYLNRVGINTMARITSRPPGFSETTLGWYKRHLPWVDRDLIYLQREGWDNSFGFSNFKVEKIRELGIDLHFEDSIEEAKLIVSETKARIVLIPQPWNLSFRESHENVPGIIVPSARFNRQAPKLVAVYFDLLGRI